MSVDTGSTRPSAQEPRRRHPWHRRHPRRLAALAAVLVSVVMWLGVVARDSINDWAVGCGHHRYDKTTSFLGALLDVPARAWRSVDVPHLVLDVKQRHMMRIYAKRREAIGKGVLETAPDDEVPGRLTVDGRTRRIRLRLKGDELDHLSSDRKWSFRIEVRDGDHLFGMRRFSIQHPATRGYQGEVLFFATLQELGVVTPRYRFVRVRLNGDDLGVMALEEHCAKEMLEHNGRRESVIVHLDERLLFHGLDDYQSAHVVSFQEQRIAGSPALQRDLETASALLRGFVQGVTPVHEAFEAEALGRFLAAVDLWGAVHTIRWHNMRFFFDPVTARLYPLGFDANLWQRLPPNVRATEFAPMAARMLEDAAVFAAYRRALTGLCERVLDGSLVARLQAVEREHLAVLQTEFVLLQPFPCGELVQRARLLLGRASEQQPLLVRPVLVETPGGPELELVDVVPYPVVVVGARWVSADGGRTAPVVPRESGAFPLSVPPRSPGRRPGVLRVPCEPPFLPGLVALEVEVAPGGADATPRTVRAVRAPQARSRSPVPEDTVDGQLRAHPFLRAEGDELRVVPGGWSVTGVLIVPRGSRLVVPAGTRLRFGREGALIAHGPVDLCGTAEQPVVLEAAAPAGGADGQGRAAAWQGVAVLAGDATSRWRHAVVRDTAGVARAGWELLGGVTFCGGLVELADVCFVGNTAEDALNIVRGRFTLTRAAFEDTASDAVDVDFGTGTVVGCTFRGIGGDALDFSGSEVDVEDVRCTDVRDKALSVGEGSRVAARGLDADRCGTVAASKDGSRLELSGVRAGDVGLCLLAAYTKEPVYGPGLLFASGVEHTGGGRLGLVQTGSTVELDGRALPSEAVDVEALYLAEMAKDAPR